MDDKDRQILMLLQQDGRMSNSAIAERVGLNPSSVYERVKKLEKRGVIKGYVAVVDAAALGRPILGFVRLTASSVGGDAYVQAREHLAELCRNDPDVLECHSVTGTDSYILKIRIANPLALEDLVARLRSNILIANTNTNIVLSTFKESTCIRPISADNSIE